MPYEIDPQIKQVLAPMIATRASRPIRPVHDIEGRREDVKQAYHIYGSLVPDSADVLQTKYCTNTADGHDLQMTLFRKQGAGTAPGPGVLYAHGGGLIAASVALYSRHMSQIVSATGVPLLAIEYRLAPEHPHPIPINDCYTGLTWFRDHSAEVGVDPARICVMGDSAGASIAGGLALMARDRGFSPRLAKQILIVPMLDDRTTTVVDKDLAKVITWNYDDNLTCWAALLGKDIVGTDKVSPYAAPARASSVRDLPPTYIDVGTLDIFRDEAIEYASRLAKEQVSVELHLHPGVPHGSPEVAVDTDRAKIIMQERLRAVKTI